MIRRADVPQHLPFGVVVVAEEAAINAGLDILDGQDVRLLRLVEFFRDLRRVQDGVDVARRDRGEGRGRVVARRVLRVAYADGTARADRFRRFVYIAALHGFVLRCRFCDTDDVLKETLIISMNNETR